MSFFGFDTVMPGDKRFGNRTNKPSQNAFDPTFDNDESLDAKIQALAAGAQEDVEIYTWGGDGYDGLGDKLDESGDDFNADTFGDFDAGNDFDFGHATPASAPQQNNHNQYSQPQQPKTKFDPSNKFAASLDDFLVDPVPRFGAPRGAQQATQQQQQQQSGPRGQAKTLEEVEAEMLAMRAKQQPPPPQQQQQQQTPQQPPSSDRKPMTVEEVEAELRARRAGGAPPAQPAQPQQPSGPPSFAAIMQSQQQQQRTEAATPQNLPPPPPPGAGAGMPPMGTIPPPLGPNADPAAIQAAQQQAQAAHFARMRALLDAMPPLVQQSILSLPPPMQFDSLETVAQNFPNLLDPSQRERAPTAEQDAVRFMMEKAQAQMAEFDRVEAKRKRRMDKINAMAKYNGLMSGSDKDFITRIQISQLITADPYADDFYAHIYFALRGGPRRPGMPPLPPPATAGNGNQKQGGKGKQKLNKQQNAMLRMQQQVERIVQSRKDRMEKSASGAALEGALGRVSLSSTKNPRQMLQVSADAAKANKERQSGDATPDAGHARDAVRQALEGASLGGNGNADLRRDPLTKHEVLRILEKLYDLVLQLEQLRRNAPPAPPAEVDPQDDAASAAKAAFDAHQAEQALVTNTLWTELRVLEPLEISDPHPFVSLLSSAKGKRLLPRALRHLSSEQTLTALTMVVASFESLDVVQNGPLLDDLSDDPSKVEARRDAERQSETFATTIVPSMMQMASTAPMRIVSGMLACSSSETTRLELRKLDRVLRSSPSF